MTGWPASIAIVGGGTAGWLAALILGAEAKRAGRPVDLTVIESSKIGTIGVGEGTTAVFRQLLAHLDLDEFDFIRETGATLKLGIRHKDWRRLGHHYDGPIDLPERVAGPGLAAYAVATGRPVAEAHLFQHLINHNRAPFARKTDGGWIAAGPFHHAYHFDQARAGAWLRRQAEGVRLIDDQVAGVETGAAGITALVLEGGARVSAEFYIDATGFRRVLVGALGAEWLSYAGQLPVNRAMPFWLDHKPGAPIRPVTLAWAQRNGWMWSIPTADRIGCGYVYSDAHTTPEAARAEIEAALGHPIEPRNDIRINAGRLRDAWVGNCLATGLAASFLEPLEATSIHGTIVQLLLLSRLLGTPDGRARFNGTVARQVDDFRDFIRLHYVSERRDSAFWRDIATSHPEAVLTRVDRAAARVPGSGDFAALPFDLPHVGAELHLPVLDGLGLLPKPGGQKALGPDKARKAALRRAREGLLREYRAAARACMPHRAFLEALAPVG